MAATLLGAIAAVTWLYLIAFRGRFWSLRGSAPPRFGPAPSVVAVIPARDEAAVIGDAVRSLLTQSYAGPFDIVVVDDHSSDGTSEAARFAARAVGAEHRIAVVSSAPLPAGWSGKLWAVRQGLIVAYRSRPEFVLLTDADIVHAPDELAGLVARAEAERYDLVSLMVRLHCRTTVERLLIPAFVYFFFKLYPPRWIADPRRRTAGAAGGCMLIRRTALERVGGVDSIRGEIIDDCALASRIKSVGRVWLGNAVNSRSIRAYDGWRSIWDMIARCAFAQLGYSTAALVGTVVAMSIMYLAPPALVLIGPWPARLLGGASWLAMSAAMLPFLRAYDCTPIWAPLLPITALFYTGATIASAVQYWRGRGGRWKGRFQAVPTS